MPIESMYSSAKQDSQENGEMAESPGSASMEPRDLEEDLKRRPLVKLKAKTPSKMKPSKTLLQFSKKKRKRSDSEGSEADMDRTPPPSPPEEESGIEKRRSGRNTKRKKYVDDVQYNFSDEEVKDLNKDDQNAAASGAIDDILGPDGAMESTENSLGAEDVGAGSGPNYAFIDPTAEDTMIVQFILASRKGTREVDDSEEDKTKVKTSENGNAEAHVEEKEGEKEEKEEKVDQEEKEEKDEKEEKEETEDQEEKVEKEDKEDEVKDEEKEKEDEKEEKTEEKMEVEEEAKEKSDDSEEVPKDDVKKEETEDVKDSEDIKESEPKTDEVKETESPAKPKEELSPTKVTKPSKTVEVEEYLVKFKNFSYLHCQWLTEDELLRGDKRVSQKIKRYQQKKEKSANVLDFCDDEPINPDYVEVDRVLDSSVHTDPDTNVSFLPLFSNNGSSCSSFMTSEMDRQSFIN